MTCEDGPRTKDHGPTSLCLRLLAKAWLRVRTDCTARLFKDDKHTLHAGQEVGRHSMSVDGGIQPRASLFLTALGGEEVHASRRAEVCQDLDLANVIRRRIRSCIKKWYRANAETERRDVNAKASYHVGNWDSYRRGRACVGARIASSEEQSLHLLSYLAVPSSTRRPTMCECQELNLLDTVLRSMMDSSTDKYCRWS